MTKRQSLKLLGEILLDRANFNVMTRYIASEANLKMMMNLLRDKSKNIQFEAFHVFKVGLLTLRLVRICQLEQFIHYLGICRQPKEATADRGYIEKKQREITRLPQVFP